MTAADLKSLCDSIRSIQLAIMDCNTVIILGRRIINSQRILTRADSPPEIPPEKRNSSASARLEQGYSRADFRELVPVSYFMFDFLNNLIDNNTD